MVNEIELKRLEAKQKLADLKFIKLEVEYLVEQLVTLDDHTSKVITIQLCKYLEYLKLTLK